MFSNSKERERRSRHQQKYSLWNTARANKHAVLKKAHVYIPPVLNFDKVDKLVL